MAMTERMPSETSHAPEAAVIAAPPAPEQPVAQKQRPSADQLPTARVQSIPPPLPPLVPPQGPALKTQPLRALSRSAADAHLAAEAKRLQWSTLFSHVKRAAAIVPSRLVGLRREAWTQQRIGLSCAALGLAIVVGSLVAGWQGVASERLDTGSHVALAVSIVAARALLAIAATCIGYALLRMGERLAFPAPVVSHAERDGQDGVWERQQS